MNYDRIMNPTVVDIPPSGIRRFFDIAAEMKDCISLGVGEPDFVTPWNIRESGIKSLKDGITCYTSNSGLLELRKLCCRYYHERFGVEYAPEQCIMTVGASEGIDLAMRVLVTPGDEVLVPEPSYVSYMPCVRLSGGVAVPIRATADNGFKLTAETIRAAITPRTKALILPFPNNPTGGIMTREELVEMSKALEGTDIIVISDEIYAELTYKGTHCAFASVPGMFERTITINGFSKAFAMTGWRLGYVMAPAPLLTQMLKIHQFTMLCASTTSQMAAVEALSHGFETDFADVRAMRREYNRRRNFVVRQFNDMGLTCFEPLGAFYAFPSIEKTGLDSETFCTRLLMEKRVAVVPGTAFGPSGEGFVRATYATSMEKLIEACRRIKEFMESLT
ncbi:MAG: aminotransferase class I/II-fold pyridoxal phosphate-dependent enzyme [Christensenellales bacterium]